MNPTDIISAVVWEDSGASLMAKLTGNDAALITQATIDSISYKVFDSADLSTIITSGSLTVSTVVFNTLQLDARWTADTLGYNFRHDAPKEFFQEGGVTYRVEYKFIPVSGEQFWAIFRVKAKAVYSS
jgi:hypothetical protein